MSTLTPRQAQIHAWIEWYFGEFRRMPTYQLVGDKFSIRNPNGVRTQLKAISRKGYLVETGHRVCPFVLPAGRVSIAFN